MSLASKFVLVLFSIGLMNCNHGGKHHDHGSHGKMWEKMDKNSDGAITKDEFDSKHAEKFKAMDTNADGKVTKEEMKSHHAAMKSEKKECCN